MNMDPRPSPRHRAIALKLTTAVVLSHGCADPGDAPQQDTDLGSETGDAETTGGPSGPCVLIEQADVEADLELEAGCYEVETLLGIEGSTISMQPGVQITFAPNAGLLVGQNAVLRAIGSAEDPVVMTAESEMPGSWAGLRFVGSASSANRLEHVELAFAGAAGAVGDAAAVALTAGSRLHVTASTIRDTAGFAISAADTSTLTLDTTVVEGNARALSVDANTVGGVAADNSFDGNDENLAIVTGGRVLSDVTWQAIGIPLQPASHLAIEAVLTLQPGLTIRMAQQAALDVLESGQLNATGTATTPVTLTGQQAEVGYWKGLSVASKSSNNVLDHCVVEYGGGDQWTGSGDSAAMVYLKADSKLRVQNSILRHSAHYAVRAERTADLSGFASNTISSNVRTLLVAPNSAGAIASDNVFEENGEQKVRVVHGNTDRIETSQTWHALPVPWLVVDRFFVAAQWSIEPDTTIEFAQDRSVIIEDGGSITAVGTANAPIVFTGVEPLAGYWQGIEVETLSAANRLEHARVEYAGSDGWVGGTDREAAIFVDGSNGGASLSLADVVIRHSAGNGILLLPQDATVTCSNVTFETIAKEAVAGTGASSGCT